MNTVNKMNKIEQYRYSLDKSSKKFPCPSCGKKRFVKYVDNKTGQYMPDVYGRCDREEHCCYHNPPKSEKNIAVKAIEKNVKTEVAFLRTDLMRKSVSQYQRCELYKFLVKLFKEEVARQLCLKYCVGSNQDGLTAF